MLNIEISQQASKSHFQLNIDAYIPTQGVSAIFGNSGAGKTTLLRCIAGLEPKLQQAKIQFNNETWHNTTSKQFVKPECRGIAYVFQDNRLFPHLSVKNNLLYALKRRFFDKHTSILRSADMFNIANLLEHYPSQLSGGELRRVSLARALISNPRLLLLDEPMVGLDQQHVNEALSALNTLLSESSCPAIYVSHNIDEISQLATELIVMSNGEIIEQGEFLSHYAALNKQTAHYQQAASILLATVSSIDEHYQLAQVSISNNLHLSISSQKLSPGNTIRVRIPAKDVSIALVSPSQSSILNILPATILSVTPNSNGRVLVQLSLGEQELLAGITSKSADELGLQPGQSVFAQIKSVSLLNRSLI